MRKKILRKPGAQDYPVYVCKRCGHYGAEDSNTRVEEHIQTQLQICGICKTMHQCATPRDFGYPEFYTYESGAPVLGRLS